MSGEAISQEEIMTLLEAGRWAPSASNVQPWRFIYALRGTPLFDLILSTLAEGNKIWCKNAGAFIIVLSKKTNDKGVANPYHSFDSGSAWENIALQGADMNLVTHGMAGYDMNALRTGIKLEDEYNSEVMIAAGRHGKIEDLPEQLQGREQPNQRKNLEELIIEIKL